MMFYNTKKNPQDNKDVVVWLSSRGKALKADFDIEDFTDESIDIPEPAECTKVADSAGV
jgi:hypothetical protein